MRSPSLGTGTDRFQRPGGRPVLLLTGIRYENCTRAAPRVKAAIVRLRIVRQPLDLAQRFGNAVHLDLGGEGGGDTRPARTLKGAVQSEREAARLVRAAVAAGAREASRRRAGAA